MFVQNERHVYGVTAHALESRQELDGRLELCRQEENPEVEEGLLVRVEVTFT